MLFRSKANPVANKAAALALLGASNPLDGIVEDAYSSGHAVRLTQVITGNNTTWVAASTYGDITTQILDWIQPQKILQANGSPSIGWTAEFWNGDPTSGGTQIATTTNAGSEVSWVFNYDNGLLLLSDSMVSYLQTTYGSVNPYIRGFYYIGQTLGSISTSSGTSGSSGTSEIGRAHV